MNTKVLLFSLLLAANSASFAVEKNGFDLTGSLVPTEQILSGGPQRDGIPAIDQPHFISAKAAGFLDEDDRVLGIEHKGVLRAYPIRILNWHEIVNDRIGTEAITITYCPLCGTGLVYSGNVGGQAQQFGVSGLLYNSDVLLYDRTTESLWSQILSQAISGKRKGTKLTTLPVLHTTWGDWRKQHPNTQVLSPQTGYNRDYARSPYIGYEDSETVYFPLNAQSSRYHPKERVLGVVVGEIYKAYPFTELAKIGSSPLRDKVAGVDVTIEFDADKRSGQVLDKSGKPLNAINSYWFAWYAFHPDTEVFEP